MPIELKVSGSGQPQVQDPSLIDPVISLERQSSLESLFSHSLTCLSIVAQPDLPQFLWEILYHRHFHVLSCFRFEICWFRIDHEAYQNGTIWDKLSMKFVSSFRWKHVLQTHFSVFHQVVSQSSGCSASKRSRRPFSFAILFATEGADRRDRHRETEDRK